MHASTRRQDGFFQLHSSIREKNWCADIFSSMLIVGNCFIVCPLLTIKTFDVEIQNPVYILLARLRHRRSKFALLSSLSVLYPWEKVWIFLSPQLWVKQYHFYSSTMLAFTFNNPWMLIYHWKEKTNLIIMIRLKGRF